VTKRLFLAVDIDQPTRDAIGEIATALRQRLGPGARATWVKPDRMHLTLHFFGDADASLEARLLAALEKPIPSRPFSVSFAGVGTFPDRGALRVIWLGLREGGEQLREVHDMLAERLGVGVERLFTPHLTLARFRGRVGHTQVGQVMGVPASAGPCPIDRVTLYESRLSPAGPVYVRLADAALKEAG
jgi:2'-5' RNA ligase